MAKSFMTPSPISPNLMLVKSRAATRMAPEAAPAVHRVVMEEAATRWVAADTVRAAVTLAALRLGVRASRSASRKTVGHRLNT